MINNWVLRTEYDAEGFDADGAGDYMYTGVNWQEFETKDEILKYLQKNIYADGERSPANFNTIAEYADTFEFKVYKRIY